MIKITNRTDLLNYLIQRVEDLTDLGKLHWDLGNVQLGWEYMDKAEVAYNEFQRLYQLN